MSQQHAAWGSVPKHRTDDQQQRRHQYRVQSKRTDLKRTQFQIIGINYRIRGLKT